MDAAEVHLLLSDRNRRRILELVLAGSPTVTDLVRATRLRQPLVSHHLRSLRAAGLVLSVREGRFRRYRPSSNEVVKALAEMGRVTASLSDAAGRAAEAGAPPTAAPKPAERRRR